MNTIKSFLLIILLSLPLIGFSAETININTADKETLISTIKGVGEKKAEAIIAYREKNGDFKSVDELSNIKGIDIGIIEKNRDNLTVE
ncbi:MAG: ComEA family DNA-binding protein [Proteobacteria bacterium]|nr:ComEA family DNA-binding protein [Pseudomonadota bacterium]